MDMERYGDYTEYEDDIPKSKSKVLLILKLLIGAVCLFVVGVIAFRLVVLNYYPDSMKKIYFTENLTEYYEAQNGEINAKTQSYPYKYDNPDFANFFCDNVIVIEGAGEIQMSVRYNLSTLDTVAEKYGLSDIDPEDTELFSFRLVASVFDVSSQKYQEKVLCAEPSYIGTDALLMYRYYKLAFDGIDFENPPVWIRIEVFVKGQSEETPFATMPAYSNSEDFAIFEDYELSEEEKPS